MHLPSRTHGYKSAAHGVEGKVAVRNFSSPRRPLRNLSLLAETSAYCIVVHSATNTLPLVPGVHSCRKLFQQDQDFVRESLSS